VTASCGETETIGTGSAMNGKTLKFHGASGNPGGDPVKVVHTIYQEDGEELVYTFPDDYTGTPDFDPNDQNPSYVFYVKFK
jgi:hypothetical protein